MPTYEEGWESGQAQGEENMRPEIERLRGALLKLSNEVMASLPLMEPLCRREFGNTNYNILIQRAEEARALLNQRK